MTFNPGQVSFSAPHCTSAAPSIRLNVPPPAPQPTAARLFISAFDVQVTVLLHIGIAANSTTASISGPAVSVARSQHQILMTSLHVSPLLKKINPKCHAHRLPVSIFEIGNRNFVGFHLLCWSDASWTLVVLRRHEASTVTCCTGL